MIDIEDERLKEKNFNAIFAMLRELEGTDATIIESLFQYKMNDRIEFEEEARLVTKEYKMGALDPTRDISKFEQKQMYRKRKEMLRKQVKRID